jgi:hypothetical protein
VTNEGNKLDAKLNPIKTPTTLINWACINICHIQHVLLIPSPTRKKTTKVESHDEFENCHLYLSLGFSKWLALLTSTLSMVTTYPSSFVVVPWFIMAILTLTLIVALDMEIALIHSLVVSTFILVTKGVMVLWEVVGNYSLLLPRVPS